MFKLFYLSTISRLLSRNSQMARMGVANGAFDATAAKICGITFGDGAKVESGAVVAKDVSTGATVVGENRIVRMPKAAEE